MKLGRTFPAVRSALEQAGRLEHALYVERASMDSERWMPVADVDPATVPYFSLIVVPGDSVHEEPGGRRVPAPVASERPAARAARGRSRSWAVGVDHPGGRGGARGGRPCRRLRPLRQPGAAAGRAQRHASGNTVEVDRARFALDLALRGERVAVVSGGDAGVFGMASAVFEAAEDPAYASVDVRVLPGLSAVQAVAARAGAPIGADFAVVSLSDRLKPWSVVEKRLRAVAEADLVLAIYNPASRSPHRAGAGGPEAAPRAPARRHRRRGRPRHRPRRGVAHGDHAGRPRRRRRST